MSKQLWRVYHRLNQDPVIRLYESYIEEKNKEKRRRIMDQMAVRLITYSQKNGLLFGFKDYVAHQVLQDENLFTCGSEKGHAPDPALMRLVLTDLKRVIRVMDAPWRRENGPTADFLAGPCRFEGTRSFLEKTPLELYRWLAGYHKARGTGVFVDHSVFKITDKGDLVPLETYDQVSFSDLIGYERQIRELRGNVESFLKGQGFNNMLLYGDRGTGKSSSVKALLHEYAQEGLRVVEMKKDQFRYFSSVANALRGRRQKCMVFIDDLSFEPDETSYKELKAVLEGSFESRPDNLMMVVTSNRRHLIKESFTDRESDIHVRESVGEQLSLFDRFGLIVYFEQPSEALFRNMVVEMARRKGLIHTEEELLRLANQWKASKGTKSGRSVQQFIESLRTP